MESSSKQLEQDDDTILEAAAAWHLILLSNSLKRSYNSIMNEDYDHDSHDHGGIPGAGGGLGLMKKKKKKQDYGVKSMVNHKNDSSANSITSSSSSSLFSESIKSGISMVEEVQEEDELTGRRRNPHRLRSIADIYRVTRPLNLI